VTWPGSLSHNEVDNERREMNLPEPSSNETSEDSKAPNVSQVWDFLMFGTSVPERLLRSTSAMIGGVLKESSELLVPQAFRTSKSYSIFVQQMLDFMTHDVGGVDRPEGEVSATDVENYVARKAVGNFIELAGLATLHLSPLTLLAVVSDIAYGSQTYLAELAVELKREGVIPEDSTIDHASDLLDAVRAASGVTAQAFDLPPTSIDGLRETIRQTQEAVGRLDPTVIFPQAEMDRIWLELQEISRKEGVSLLGVGGAVTLLAADRFAGLGAGALSAVRVAGNLVDAKVLQHYSDSLSQIHDKGFYQSLADVSGPYLEAVWDNFSMEKTTITQEVLSGRLTGRLWQNVGAWLKASPGEKLPDASPDEEVAAVSEEKLDVRIESTVQGLRVAIIVIRSASVVPTSASELAYLKEKLKQDLAHAEVQRGEARRTAVRDLLRRGGYRPAGRNKPAQEYLAGVFQRDGALPVINNAVDVLNTHSLAIGLPISLLSLTKAPGPWVLRYGKANEKLLFNASGQELAAEHLLCVVTQASGVPVGSPVKDSMAGKIQADDRDLAFCIYAPQSQVSEHELRQAAEALAKDIEASTHGVCNQITLLESSMNQ
jgi:DNA/RNA-binding domain of Phe-tRNA-synthetase-like protein